MGVPVIGCGCAVCRSQDPRNQRLRASIMVRAGALSLLVDAGPDLRTQALREGLRELDAVVRERTEYELAFRKSYLGGNIRYDLGPEEKQGIAKFIALLRQHQTGQVYAPRFVG